MQCIVHSYDTNFSHLSKLYFDAPFSGRNDINQIINPLFGEDVYKMVSM